MIWFRAIKGMQTFRNGKNSTQVQFLLFIIVNIVGNQICNMYWYNRYLYGMKLGIGCAVNFHLVYFK